MLDEVARLHAGLAHLPCAGSLGHLLEPVGKVRCRIGGCRRIGRGRAHERQTVDDAPQLISEAASFGQRARRVRRIVRGSHSW